MKGVIFQAFKEYLQDRLGKGGWSEVVKGTNVETTLFASVKSYSALDFLSLFDSSSKKTGLSARTIMEEFGKHMALNFYATRPYLFRPEWGLFDAMENLKATITTICTSQTSDEPDLRQLVMMVTRDSPTQATMHYSSPNKLCSIWKGCIRGAAIHYGNRIELTEPICMHENDDECEIIVKIIGDLPKSPPS